MSPCWGGECAAVRSSRYCAVRCDYYHYHCSRRPSGTHPPCGRLAPCWGGGCTPAGSGSWYRAAYFILPSCSQPPCRCLSPCWGGVLAVCSTCPDRPCTFPVALQCAHLPAAALSAAVCWLCMVCLSVSHIELPAEHIMTLGGCTRYGPAAPEQPCHTVCSTGLHVQDCPAVALHST